MKRKLLSKHKFGRTDADVTCYLLI